MSKITPFLYLGNWDDSINLELLERYQIKAVININERTKPLYILHFYKKEGIDYIHIPIPDLPMINISYYFSETTKFIENHISNNKAVLVNCAMGISRSATIVLAYILFKIYDTNNSMPPDKALEYAINFVRLSRPIINPNPGFMLQLEKEAIKLFNLYNTSFEKTNKQNYLKGNINTKMCDNIINPATGKPANIICLQDDDFDQDGNLVNFKDVDGVVFYYADFCGHCQKMKPEVALFADTAPVNIRVFAVDAAKHQNLLAKINPEKWGYRVTGFPTVVSYNMGKFFSEYAFDPSHPEDFRTANDLKIYALGIGKAPVQLREVGRR